MFSYINFTINNISDAVNRVEHSFVSIVYAFATIYTFYVLYERMKGIEPSSSTWKEVALPLSYTRMNIFICKTVTWSQNISCLYYSDSMPMSTSFAQLVTTFPTTVLRPASKDSRHVQVSCPSRVTCKSRWESSFPRR